MEEKDPRPRPRKTSRLAALNVPVNPSGQTLPTFFQRESARSLAESKDLKIDRSDTYRLAGDLFEKGVSSRDMISIPKNDEAVKSEFSKYAPNYFRVQAPNSWDILTESFNESFKAAADGVELMLASAGGIGDVKKTRESQKKLNDGISWGYAYEKMMSEDTGWGTNRGKFWSAIGSGVGQLGTMAAAAKAGAMAAGAAGTVVAPGAGTAIGAAGGAITGAAAAIPFMFASFFDDAVEAGIKENHILPYAYGTSAAMSAIEMLPFGRMVGRLGGKKILNSAASELIGRATSKISKASITDDILKNINTPNVSNVLLGTYKNATNSLKDKAVFIARQGAQSYIEEAISAFSEPYAESLSKIAYDKAYGSGSKGKGMFGETVDDLTSTSKMQEALWGGIVEGILSAAPTVVGSSMTKQYQEGLYGAFALSESKGFSLDQALESVVSKMESKRGQKVGDIQITDEMVDTAIAYATDVAETYKGMGSSVVDIGARKLVFDRIRDNKSIQSRIQALNDQKAQVEQAIQQNPNDTALYSVNIQDIDKEIDKMSRILSFNSQWLRDYTTKYFDIEKSRITDSLSEVNLAGVKREVKNISETYKGQAARNKMAEFIRQESSRYGLAIEEINREYDGEQDMIVSQNRATPIPEQDINDRALVSVPLLSGDSESFEVVQYTDPTDMSAFKYAFSDQDGNLFDIPDTPFYKSRIESVFENKSKFPEIAELIASGTPLNDEQQSIYDEFGSYINPIAEARKESVGGEVSAAIEASEYDTINEFVSNDPNFAENYASAVEEVEKLKELLESNDVKTQIEQNPSGITPIVNAIQKRIEALQDRINISDSVMSGYEQRDPVEVSDLAKPIYRQRMDQIQIVLSQLIDGLSNPSENKDSIENAKADLRSLGYNVDRVIDVLRAEAKRRNAIRKLLDIENRSKSQEKVKKLMDLLAQRRVAQAQLDALNAKKRSDQIASYKSWAGSIIEKILKRKKQQPNQKEREKFDKHILELRKLSPEAADEMQSEWDKIGQKVNNNNVNETLQQDGQDQITEGLGAQDAVAGTGVQPDSGVQPVDQDIAPEAPVQPSDNIPVSEGAGGSPQQGESVPGAQGGGQDGATSGNVATDGGLQIPGSPSLESGVTENQNQEVITNAEASQTNQESTQGGVLEGVRDGGQEAQGGQDGPELRTEEEVDPLADVSSTERALAPIVNSPMSKEGVVLRVLSGLITHNGSEKITKFDSSKIKGESRGRYGKGFYFSNLYKNFDYGDQSTFVDASKLNFIDGNLPLSRVAQSLLSYRGIKNELKLVQNKRDSTRSVREFDELDNEYNRLSSILGLIDEKNWGYIEKAIAYTLSNNPNGLFSTFMERRESIISEANNLGPIAVPGMDESINELIKQSGFDGISIDQGREIVITAPDYTINRLIVESQERFISEAYHKAKKDNSNPELVKEVEGILVGPQEEVEAQAPSIRTSAIDLPILDQAIDRASQSKFATAHARDTGGMPYELDGDIGIIQAFNLYGRPVYSAYKGYSMTRVDISSFTGDLFSEGEKSKLLELKAEIEKNEANKEGDPFLAQGQVASTDSVPDNIKSFVLGLTKALGLSKNIFIVTDGDLDISQFDKHGLYGKFAQIRSAKLSESDSMELGSMRYMASADAYYIYYKGNLTPEALFSIISHEFGHIVEKETLKDASKETRDAILGDYKKWYANLSGKPLTQVINETRDITVQDLLNMNSDRPFDYKNDSYISSFSEWFADNVAKWARTSEKPKTLVDKFFADLVEKFKKIYNYVFDTGFYSNSIFDWLDGLYTPQEEVDVDIPDPDQVSDPEGMDQAQAEVSQIDQQIAAESEEMDVLPNEDQVTDENIVSEQQSTAKDLAELGASRIEDKNFQKHLANLERYKQMFPDKAAEVDAAIMALMEALPPIGSEVKLNGATFSAVDEVSIPRSKDNIGGKVKYPSIRNVDAEINTGGLVAILYSRSISTSGKQGLLSSQLKSKDFFDANITLRLNISTGTVNLIINDKISPIEVQDLTPTEVLSLIRFKDPKIASSIEESAQVINDVSGVDPSTPYHSLILSIMTKMPSLKFSVLDDIAWAKNGLAKTARGAFDPNTGTIFLRKGAYNQATILHEAGHAIVSVIKQANPDLYGKLAALTKGTVYESFVKNNYGLTDPDAIASETLGQIIEDKGVRLSKGRLGSFEKLKKSITKAISDFFEIEINGSVDDITLEDFASLVSEALTGTRDAGILEQYLTGKFSSGDIEPQLAPRRSLLYNKFKMKDHHVSTRLQKPSTFYTEVIDMAFSGEATRQEISDAIRDMIYSGPESKLKSGLDSYTNPLYVRGGNEKMNITLIDMLSKPELFESIIDDIEFMGISPFPDEAILSSGLSPTELRSNIKKLASNFFEWHASTHSRVILNGKEAFVNIDQEAEQNSIRENMKKVSDPLGPGATLKQIAAHRLTKVMTGSFFSKFQDFRTLALFMGGSDGVLQGIDDLRVKSNDVAGAAQYKIMRYLNNTVLPKLEELRKKKGKSYDLLQEVVQGVSIYDNSTGTPQLIEDSELTLGQLMTVAATIKTQESYHKSELKKSYDKSVAYVKNQELRLRELQVDTSLSIKERTNKINAVKKRIFEAQLAQAKIQKSMGSDAWVDFIPRIEQEIADTEKRISTVELFKTPDPEKRQRKLAKGEKRIAELNAAIDEFLIERPKTYMSDVYYEPGATDNNHGAAKRKNRDGNVIYRGITISDKGPWLSNFVMQNKGAHNTDRNLNILMTSEQIDSLLAMFDEGGQYKEEFDTMMSLWNGKEGREFFRAVNKYNKELTGHEVQELDFYFPTRAFGSIKTTGRNSGSSVRDIRFLKEREALPGRVIGLDSMALFREYIEANIHFMQNAKAAESVDVYVNRLEQANISNTGDADVDSQIRSAFQALKDWHETTRDFLYTRHRATTEASMIGIPPRWSNIIMGNFAKAVFSFNVGNVLKQVGTMINLYSVSDIDNKNITKQLGFLAKEFPMTYARYVAKDGGPIDQATGGILQDSELNSIMNEIEGHLDNHGLFGNLVARMFDMSSNTSGVDIEDVHKIGFNDAKQTPATIAIKGYNSAMDHISSYALEPMRRADRLIIAAIYKAAKDQVSDLVNSGNLFDDQGNLITDINNIEAIKEIDRLATDLVYKSNNMHAMNDRTPVQNSTSMITRALALFTSQPQKIWNTATQAMLISAQDGHKDPYKLDRAMSQFFNGIIVASVYQAAVTTLWGIVRNGYDEEKNYRQDIAVDFIRNILGMTPNFPISVISGLLTTVDDRSWTDSSVGAPVIFDMASDMIKLAQSMSDSIDEDKPEYLRERALRNLTRDGVNTLSRALGFPVTITSMLMKMIQDNEGK